MERNRRIGKAYTRPQIVTIDGSRQLSYNGYKLALNGFDNPDRDAETEECRERIGKGIRIKLDTFGNILIKRLSKSPVFIKDLVNPAALASGGSSNGSGGDCNAGASGSGPTSTGMTNNRGGAILSRQQLIKNQSVAFGGGGGGGSRLLSSLSTSAGTPSNSSTSGGSSIEAQNDSAICDEVISVAGRLEQDKIYVMFDMHKFRANITQELCRPYPNRRKLEQQCFTIVGLCRDSDDVLNLPCWVMVINVVGLDMLMKFFPPEILPIPPAPPFERHPQQRQDRRGGNRLPEFVSIFDRRGGGRANSNTTAAAAAAEEDPYSLPANASSSDVKSSVNDYGTTSTKNISSFMDASGGQSSRYYQNNGQRIYQTRRAAGRADLHGSSQLVSGGGGGGGRMLPQSSSASIAALELARQRSKSSSHLHSSKGADATASSKLGGRNTGERYNNSTSIYSPGHMLVRPTPPGGCDSTLPPKLPPRDFVGKQQRGKSKSSQNIVCCDLNSSPSANEQQNRFDNNDENIYSTGLTSATAASEQPPPLQRKAKKNRFLESLKNPLAKTSSKLSPSNGQEASTANLDGFVEPTATPAKPSKSRGFKKSSAKNLRSFLGVGSKSSAAAKENNNSVEETRLAKTKTLTDGQADSVVDSNEDEPEEEVPGATSTSLNNSYNDLDIPTPDYETDENIYALEEASFRELGNQRRYLQHSNTSATAAKGTKQRIDSKEHSDDLYYSGFRDSTSRHLADGNLEPEFDDGDADLRSGSRLAAASTRWQFGKKSINGGAHQNATTSRLDNNNRYLMKSAMAAHKTGAREVIYGSAIGLPATTRRPTGNGSYYRSASMQRYCSRAQFENQYELGLIGGDNRCDDDCADLCAAAAAQQADDHYSQGGELLHQRHNYGQIGNGRRRRISTSKLAQLERPCGGTTPATASANVGYDIGRSSSGIYGNNSSNSSSSDYVDWHPQMRKVNSSSYLSSMFRGGGGHVGPAAASSQQKADAEVASASSLYTSSQAAGAGKTGNKANSMLLAAKDANSSGGGGDGKSGRNINTAGNKSSKLRSYASSTLEPGRQQRTPAAAASLQPLQLGMSSGRKHQQQQPGEMGLATSQQQQRSSRRQVAPQANNSTTYPSYDSSNGKLLTQILTTKGQPGDVST